jgi:alkanesulfonate monooxygenase SsuD/methylene tetrahydromethanopterin reductase-like flavin-dependent oxidoreductase (luciferase family)
MRYGFVLPGGTATEQVAQAMLAEQAGWDGVFVCETAYGVDAWGLLSAMAAMTSQIRLGTMLTPLPWRRPWKVAAQVATLDQLSRGRAVLAVGLGAVDPALPDTGEVTDVRTRAEQLDEGIDLMRTLWSGESSYRGDHYRYESPDEFVRVGKPVQETVPIWVVGAWPRPKSMRRALRCEGVIPEFQLGERAGTPDDIRELRDWLTEHDARPDIDIVVDGETSADDSAAAVDHVAPWADAGCTWWLETRWMLPHHTADSMDRIRLRIEAGPPTPTMA